MSTGYPTSIDGAATLKTPINATDLTPTALTHAQQHNNQSDALIAVEAALGTLPKGSYSTMSGRAADGLYKTPSADQVIQASVDAIGLAIKAKAAQTKDLFEAQDKNGVMLAKIDVSGNLDTEFAFKINNVLLASTHLTDSALLARLNSPAFTGTPVAPTPTAGDNSQKLATTAFIAAQIANLIPLGAVIPFSGAEASIPSGFMNCDGSAISRTTYASLYAIFGTTYGAGNGTTTFNLPDLRGRSPVGLGTHIDVSTLGKNDGAALANRRPTHQHGLGTLAIGLDAHGITDPGHSHSITDSGHTHAVTDGGHSHTATDGGHGHTVSSTHSHSASGSSGTFSPPSHNHSITVTVNANTLNDTKVLSVPSNSSTAQNTGSSSESHTHSVSVSVNANSTGISSPTASATTGITLASATTGITLASATTGISINNGTTGMTVATHTASPSGNLGTTTSAPAEAPAYIVMVYIVRVS